jgi:DNA-binding NarL/FixJ family response regulator
VLNYTRISKDEWNQLIGHISGGLLYGHEVARPTWYEPRRKRRYAAQLRRPPCERREEVRKRMVLGMKLVDIAMEMKVDIDSVRYHVDEVYRQARVKNLKEFRKKFCHGNLQNERGRAAESTCGEPTPAARGAEREHAEDHACA